MARRAPARGSSPPPTAGRQRFRDIHGEELEFIHKRRRAAGLAGTGDASVRQDLFGLSLSGGGIRSASFSLGVLEYLHEAGLFPRLDYLSTVSGGGFMGAALLSQLYQRPGFPFAKNDHGRDDGFVRHLRAKASYLAPLGLLSTEGRELLTTYLFGVGLNGLHFMCLTGLLLAPVMLLVVLATAWRWCVVGGAAALGVGFLAGTYVALLREIRRAHRDGHASAAAHAALGFNLRGRQRRRLRRAAFLVAVAVVYLGLCTLSDSVTSFEDAQKWPLLIVSVVGAVNTPLLGALIALAMRTPALTRQLPSLAIQVGALALLVMLLIVHVLVYGLVRVSLHGRFGAAVSERDEALICFVALGAMWGVGMLLVLFVRHVVAPGAVSLHDLYRDRLNAAFVVEPARHGAHGPGGSAFVPDTGLLLADFRDHPDDGRSWPYPIINVTMNYTRSSERAPALRQAGRFTLTPHFSGSYETDYADTRRYGTLMTLATAATISGAAISPRMGFYTEGLLPFLLSFFNLRLGKLVPNPHRRDWPARELAGPRERFLGALWRFGKYTERSPFCYLSDGGHSENLGLASLLRRRCRYIVAIDAEEDGEHVLAGLGNALRIARLDLGVQVDIDVSGMAPTTDGTCGRCFAIGRIRYRGEPESGTLLYIKASACSGLPPDLLHYQRTQPRFPHESTAQQFYSETRFEAYRQLGHHCTATAFAAARRDGQLPRDVDAVFAALRGEPDAAPAEAAQGRGAAASPAKAARASSMYQDG